MSDFKKKFGANLKAIRKSRKVTQEQLAELIDVHYRQMSKIETGENFPSAKTLEKLCYALKISPIRLFEFEFEYEGEIILTGTDAIPYYKAIKRGNVVVLEDYRGKKVEQEEIPATDSDQRFLNIAKNLNKTITVEYFEDGKKSKTINYNPNGTISSQIKDYSSMKEIEDLVELIKKKQPNSNHMNFIKLAVQALEDNAALERLELMISGIKMVKK